MISILPDKIWTVDGIMFTQKKDHVNLDACMINLSHQKGNY